MYTLMNNVVSFSDVQRVFSKLTFTGTWGRDYRSQGSVRVLFISIGSKRETTHTCFNVEVIESRSNNCESLLMYQYSWTFSCRLVRSPSWHSCWIMTDQALVPTYSLNILPESTNKLFWAVFRDRLLRFRFLSMIDCYLIYSVEFKFSVPIRLSHSGNVRSITNVHRINATSIERPADCAPTLNAV